MARKPTVVEMASTVRAHAESHYGRGGWDYIVEAYTDGELAELIEETGATTRRDAIRKVAKVVSLLDERRREVYATRW